MFSDHYQPHFNEAQDLSGLLLLGLLVGIMVGLSEEMGWTGYATPALRHHFGMVPTGVIIGLVWGAWHFIPFWEEDSFSEPLPFFLLMARLFFWLPAYRILMVWVNDKSKILLKAVLMHASLVTSLAIIDPVLPDRELLWYILCRAGILWVLVGILAIHLREKGRHHKVSA